MKMKLYLPLTLFGWLALAACTSPENTRQPGAKSASKQDSLLMRGQVGRNDSTMETGCVFDTASHSFTTEKIIAYNSSLAFTWNDSTKEATVPLPGGDTLVLHIGGCEHFSFEGTYSTGPEKFTDKDYLLGKAKWIAANFFGQGYDTKYVEVIEKKQYHISRQTDEEKNFYEVVTTDSTITDHVYEGFSFARTHGRTVIWIGGYTN